MSQQRRLAAILFTDIVGSTSMMQKDEQAAVLVNRRYVYVLKESVLAHGGEILNDFGDGSLCTFSSATEALSCAIEMQQQFQAEPQVPLRIGLHVGEIFFEDGKVFGDGVNVASRVQSIGTANSILFSSEINSKVKNHPEFKSVSLGQFEFKNVAEPIEIFALADKGLNVPDRKKMEGKLRKKTTSKLKLIIAGAIIFLLFASAVLYKQFFNKQQPAGKKNSIAVLYFTNMSGDPSEEYFSDGITEEIITRLSMISGLKVKSRTSVLQYKDEKKSATQIANELGVNNILEGSLRKQGNKIRITAQLIDAETDEHIWSVDYDRELKDIFEVQSDIAQNIATKFQIKLSEATRKKVETPPTLNTEAYDLYLKAASLSFIDIGAGGAQANTLKAIALLRKVIQLDPSFSDAYALLSGNFSYYSRDAENPKRWIDSAMILANTAIKFNPQRVDGYSAVAYVYSLRGNPDEALKWSLKAHELVPFSSVSDIINIYQEKKDYKNAIEWVMKAIQYDPSEPAYYLNKAGIFYCLGLADSTKNYFDLAKRIQPEQFYSMGSGFEFYLTTGNYEEFQKINRTIISNDDSEYNYQIAVFYLFRRNWKKADSLYSISSHPEDMDAGLVKIHLGNKEQGAQFLKKAIDQRERFETFNNSGTSYDICRAYAALQDSRYTEYFNKALQKGWHNYSFFENDPFFDFVKNKPEFKKLKQQFDERNEQFKAAMYEGMKKFYDKDGN